MIKAVSRLIVICLLPLLAMFAHAQQTSEQKAPKKEIDNPPSALKPYTAEYKLFRDGDEHGTATRKLSFNDNIYTLKYQSSIEWMIFSDERFESSQFFIQNNRVKPLVYKMERKGTGPDRSYEVIFDRENREIKGPSKRSKKRKSDNTLQVLWNDNWLDPISYQQQLYLDLTAGRKEFNYAFINRKGDEHKYFFKLTATEQLGLPYGAIEAVKVERIYEDSERQTIAWFAPTLDYALVRIWKGKSGVEQFDLQLAKFSD